jgi:hypothetical protein
MGFECHLAGHAQHAAHWDAHHDHLPGRLELAVLGWTAAVSVVVLAAFVIWSCRPARKVFRRIRAT